MVPMAVSKSALEVKLCTPSLLMVAEKALAWAKPDGSLGADLKTGFAAVRVALVKVVLVGSLLKRVEVSWSVRLKAAGADMNKCGPWSLICVCVCVRGAGGVAESDC